MNKRIALPTILILLTLLFGCETYTARSAKESIQTPTPIGEGELVTKYSLLVAEQKAKEEAEAEAEQKQRYEDAQAVIASLQAEKRLLEKDLQENQKALTDEQNNTKNLRELLEERNLSVESKGLEYMQKTGELQTTITTLQAEIEALHQKIAENEQAYEMLTYQANELENLLSEQQIINRELQTIIHEAEVKHTSEVESLKAAQEQRLLELQDTIESLQTDKAILTAQLEEKTQSLEERLSLEQQRIEEAKRIEEERLEKQREKAEELRTAEEAEKARLAALEAEYQQIPPLPQLTLPRMYTTDEATILAAEKDQLNVLMLPLDDIPWKDTTMPGLVKTSISDIQSPVILVTGHMQNVIDLVRQLRRNAVLVEGGAIITSFPIISTTKHGASVQFSNTKTLRLSITNLPEYEVLSAFTSGNDWKTIQRQGTSERTKVLKGILGEGTVTEPTIMGASLFEPSYQDWNTFSPVPYRQIDYIWPLSNFLEESSFYDVYRVTHFSADTDAGNTFLTENLKERIDYIYSRKVLPLQSSMLTIGGESLPDAQGIARYGISATFLIP
jgi:hypothetical protein